MLYTCDRKVYNAYSSVLPGLFLAAMFVDKSTSQTEVNSWIYFYTFFVFLSNFLMRRGSYFKFVSKQTLIIGRPIHSRADKRQLLLSWCVDRHFTSIMGTVSFVAFCVGYRTSCFNISGVAPSLQPRSAEPACYLCENASTGKFVSI